MRKIIGSKAFLIALVAANLTGQQAHAGAIIRLFYGGDPATFPYTITGTTVADLTNNVNFPQNPTSYETRNLTIEGSNNWGDNYGSLMEGFLEAPQTGAYTFWVESADDSQLWLSTDENPIHRQLIALVSGKTGPRAWNVYPSQQSAPIDLIAGKFYYLRVLQKAGTGPDNVGVGWQMPDGTLEQPLLTYHVQPYTNAVTTAQITRQPANSTVTENTVVIFKITMNPSAQPNTYQWYQDNVLIPGANLSAYSRKAKLSDNGKKFMCKVNNTLSSATATLVVVPDTTPPTILQAGPNGNPNAVTILFSKEVSSDSATNTANYRIDNGAIVQTATQIRPDTVVLATALHQGALYTLTVNHITDIATVPNAIAPNSQVAFALTDGAVQLKFWDDVAGTNFNSIMSNLDVLNTPASRSYWNTAFETPTWDNGSNYLGQIAGYITPFQGGDYVFAVAAADSAVLYLSTDDHAANITPIATITDTFTGQREFTKLIEQASAPITLVAGGRYYLEVLWKAGNGQNGAAVTWQVPSGAALANGQPAIQGLYLSSLKTPGRVRITNQPPAVFRGIEGQPATVSIGPDGVDGTPLYYYQWLRNGTNIPGADNYFYATPPLVLSDDGALYSLMVSNSFSVTTSAVSRLTIDLDVTPPSLLGAGCLKPPLITVTFSEPLDLLSATNLTNYVLKSFAGQVVPLTKAELTSLGNIVNITASSLLPGYPYTLTVTNIKDLSVRGNTLTNATATFVPLNLTVASINNDQNYSVDVLGNSLTIGAGGADIGGAADQFVYAYLPVSGNFDYRLNVHSLTNSDPAAKCGLMARESSAPGSRFIFNSVTPPQGSNNYVMLFRSDPDSASIQDSARPPARYPNSWLRLQRTNSLFNSYWSADGSNWTQYAFHDTTNDLAGPLPADLLLGIATTSHNTAQTTTAVVSDFGPWPLAPLFLARFDSIVKQGTNVVVTWSGGGVLQSSTNVTGTWLDMPGTNSPYTTTITEKRLFFRLHN